MSTSRVDRFSRRGVACFLVALAMLGPSCSMRNTAIFVEPTALDFGRSAALREMTVSSKASSPMDVTLAPSEPWIVVSPAALTLKPDADSVRVTVQIMKHLMKPAGNAGALLVQAHGLQAIHVPISADVVLAANFTREPARAVHGQPISFTDTSRALSGLEGTMKYRWDFGDGAASNEQNPVHAYATPGNFDVTLEVESGALKDSRIWKQCVEVIRPQGPRADFSASTRNPVRGNPVQFVDMSLPGTGSIIEWLWDFGDGSSSTLSTPSHIYTASAVYDVYLTVTTPYGSDTEIKIGYIDGVDMDSPADSGPHAPSL